MSFYNTLDNLRDGSISQIEVINEILNQTQKEPERIEMYINEIDLYLISEKDELESEIHVFLDKLFSNEFNIELDVHFLSEQEKYVFDVCQKKKIESYFELPYKEITSLLSEGEKSRIIEYEKTFFPYEFYSIYSLKNKLQNYITPQQIIPKQKKYSKNVWGLVARFELLNDLGVISTLKNLSETDKAKVISQILGCNEDNAKKLKNGTYPTSETQNEQLERNQLISKIIHHPTS